MPVRKYRRDQSEVSCCLKYVIFSFNVIFWVRVGCTITKQRTFKLIVIVIIYVIYFYS